MNTTAPYQAHSETSKAAAEAIEDKLQPLEKMVLSLLKRHIGDHTCNGLTDEEIQQETGLSGDTERPRRVKLCSLGLVRDSGRKLRTSSGRMAVVWEAV